MATKLVPIICVKPFTGSYVCELAEADYVTEEWVQDTATGNLVKRAVPRKRFFGAVPVERWMTTAETDLLKADKLPHYIVPYLSANGELDPKMGARCVENPPEQFVWVPPEVAEDLVKRGLARHPQENEQPGTSLAAKLKPAA